MDATANVEEQQTLDLLRDAQAELRDGLNALGGQQADGLLENYRFWTISHINRTAEGYLYLRSSGRIDASKNLLRPAIEAVFRLQAVRAQADLLFRIAFSEFAEDRKWLRLTTASDNLTAQPAIEAQWLQFKTAYALKYPDQLLVEQSLPLRAAAQYAGLEGYYDTHYRLYCRFTHAAFRAVTGNLNAFESHDNRTMILCTLAGVENLTLIGAPSPNLDWLRQRLGNLTPDDTS
jgi:hypothetical protein